MPEPLLEVRNLNGYYGSAHVLQDVSLDVGADPVAVIGRNGMGKSTLCLALLGLLHSTSGSARFQGQELVGLPPYKIAALGIGYVPQGRRLFQSLTVEEHLRLVAGRRNGSGWTAAGCTSCSRASSSAGASAPCSSRAASSRCLRLRAPSCSTRSC